MSTVIDEYFNGNFHFVPPRENNLTLEEALKQLHMKIGECLNLKPGQKCVDIGCGIGGVIQDLSETGADITGVTIASNEVRQKLTFTESGPFLNFLRFFPKFSSNPPKI